MTNRILTVLVLVMFGISCKKDNQQNNVLPDITQDGRNTLGCYIGADQFIAATTLFGYVHPVNVQYYTDTANGYPAGSLFIQGIDARSTLPIAGSILIQKMNVFTTGTYPLIYVSNCNKDFTCDATSYESSQPDQTFYADSGELVITRLDTINKIVSGTFHFSAKDTSGLVKKISGGRFDAQFTNH